MKQLAQALAIIALALTGHAATATDLYVSTEGNDAWTGTLRTPNPARTDGPLASLGGARDAIRKLKAAGAFQQPVCVRVQSGQYPLVAPVVFEPRDSGTEQCPIRYVGDPGTKPVISGGRQITGWRKQGQRWVTHLPEVEAGHWTFAALWINGQRPDAGANAKRGLFLHGRQSSADHRPQDRQAGLQRSRRVPFQAG